MDNVALVGKGTSSEHWLLASVNGGLWKTDDLYTASPVWTSATDGEPVTVRVPRTQNY